jgi:hypothetical protein
MWEIVRQEFEPDGSLRDIYVLNTDLHDWEKALAFLKSSGNKLEFSTGDTPASVPENVASIFNHNEIERSLLQIDLGEIILRCHFFSEDEIEFDLDPRNINDGRSFDRLLAFVKSLGETLGKAVIVTPESHQKAAFLKFIPQTKEIKYLPVN